MSLESNFKFSTPFGIADTQDTWFLCHDIRYKDTRYNDTTYKGMFKDTSNNYENGTKYNGLVLYMFITILLLG